MPAETTPVRPGVNAVDARARTVRVPRLDIEGLAWVVVLAIAAAWRLVGLSDATPLTSEGLRARAAWEFAHGTATAAWPGDLTPALGALLIKLGWDGIGGLRFVSALFGIGLVAAVALLRPYAGRAPALLTALLLAVSPAAVAAARRFAPDGAGLLAGLVVLWLVLRIGERGGRWALPALGAAVGLALTTSAGAVALMIIVGAWAALEWAWLGDDGFKRNWRGVLGDRVMVRNAILFALPGLALGVIRFGAGPERLSLAALTDWSGPPADVPDLLPWHAPLTVLAAYEPLALLVGGAGLVFIIARWARGGTRSVTPFERLLVVWTAAGLLLTLAALHHRPGEMLVAFLPLMLCAGLFAAWALPALGRFRPRESGLPLLVAAVIGVYVALKLLTWADQSGLPNGDVAAMVVLLAVAAALVAWALWRSPGAAAGILVTGAWLLLGAHLLHADAALVSAGGDEILWGGRALASRTVLVQGVDAALDRGDQVAVQRNLAAALAWELRGRDVRTFVGRPPDAALVIAGSVTGVPAGYVMDGPVVPVAVRWYPSSWDVTGMIRWLVYRQRWGPAQPLSGEVLRRSS